MNIIKKMYWCKHEHIVVSHFLDDNINMIGCRIRCAACDSYIHINKNEKIEKSYEYIERNRDRFKTLYDCTGDNLNERYNIEDGFYYL